MKKTMEEATKFMKPFPKKLILRSAKLWDKLELISEELEVLEKRYKGLQQIAMMQQPLKDRKRTQKSFKNLQILLGRYIESRD
jgi:hypothetical protein